MHPRMHDGEVPVDTDLARRLLDTQFPDLAHLPLRDVAPWGTDHAVWRLGDDLVLRLPRIGWAAGQPRHEARWLPRLAALLPVELPAPVRLGDPAFGYPFHWTVARWLAGEPAELTPGPDLAADLGALIHRLADVPTDGAPAPHGRARPLVDYDDQVRSAIDSAAALVDADAAFAVWHRALDAAPYSGPARWVHGDLAGNALVRDGRLTAVIDWGGSCLGDPAVDVAALWTPMVDPADRRRFLDAAHVDDATVERSRGAALHQACAALPYYADTHPPLVARARHQLRALGVPLTGAPPS